MTSTESTGRVIRAGIRAVNALQDAELTDLERLLVLRTITEHVSASLMPDAVQAALDHGETWQAIADSLGLRSRQAAQQQWGRRLTVRRLA